MKLYEFNRNTDIFDESAFKFFLENGCVVIKGFLEDRLVEKVKKTITELASYEQRNGCAHFYGDNLQRVWNLLNKNMLFHELLLSKQLDIWLNRIFERNTIHQKYYLSSFQANILKPGAEAQILHTDTPIPEPIPPYAIKANTIWLLDDFTENNGATEVVFKSQNNELRPPREPSLQDQEKLHKIVAPSGSVIITHGNLWHRSGNNQSNNSRMVLLGSYAASYAREISSEDDSARFLCEIMRSKMDPKLYEIIGGNHGIKPGNNYSQFDMDIL